MLGGRTDLERKPIQFLARSKKKHYEIKKRGRGLTRSFFPLSLEMTAQLKKGEPIVLTWKFYTLPSLQALQFPTKATPSFALILPTYLSRNLRGRSRSTFLYLVPQESDPTGRGTFKYFQLFIPLPSSLAKRTNIGSPLAAAGGDVGERE